MKEREAWRAAVHGVAKSWTWLSDWTTRAHQKRTDSITAYRCYYTDVKKRKCRCSRCNLQTCPTQTIMKNVGGRSQDGGGIGRGDHFLSYKFIERTIERWTKFTKQLLIASSGHQAPRKAARCLRREVGQNIKRLKRGDKRARDRDPGSREGSLNRGSFQTPGNPRAGGSGGSFQITEGNLTGRRN